MPLVAYVDTNVFGHIRSKENGVTAEHVQRLRAVVASGELVIPASVVVAEELLATIASSPARAFSLGRLYLELASMNHCIKPAGDLMRDAIDAYVSRGATRIPYAGLSEDEKEHWRAISTGRIPTGHLLGIVDGAGEQKRKFLAFMNNAYPVARDLFRRRKEQRERPLGVREFWNMMSVHYAEGFARGRVKAVRKRGIKGLLDKRIIRAAVGYAIVLVHTQAVTGKKPDVGDSRDMQHVVMAASVGKLLVTHDEPFARQIRQIPGFEMEVLSLPALLDRL